MHLKRPEEHTEKELIGLLRLQLDLQDHYSEIIPRSITGLHRFFKIYIKGFPGANDLRVQLMNTKSTDEVREILETFEKNIQRFSVNNDFLLEHRELEVVKSCPVSSNKNSQTKIALHILSFLS